MRLARLPVVVLATKLFACVPPEGTEASPDPSPAPVIESDWLRETQLPRVAEHLAAAAEDEVDDADHDGFHLAPAPELADQSLVRFCTSEERSRGCIVPQHVASPFQRPDGAARVSEAAIALRATFPDETRPIVCAGWLVGADAVLTRASCLYDEERGGAATSVRVVHEAQAAWGARLFVPLAYRHAGSAAARTLHDFAVVRTEGRFEKPVRPSSDALEDALIRATIEAWVTRPRGW